eukprot:7382799-Prymnesium_polylepis.2
MSLGLSGTTIMFDSFAMFASCARRTRTCTLSPHATAVARPLRARCRHGRDASPSSSSSFVHDRAAARVCARESARAHLADVLLCQPLHHRLFASRCAKRRADHAQPVSGRLCVHARHHRLRLREQLDRLCAGVRAAWLSPAPASVRTCAVQATTRRVSPAWSVHACACEARVSEARARAVRAVPSAAHIRTGLRLGTQPDRLRLALGRIDRALPVALRLVDQPLAVALALEHLRAPQPLSVRLLLHRLARCERKRTHAPARQCARLLPEHLRAPIGVACAAEPPPYRFRAAAWRPGAATSLGAGARGAYEWAVARARAVECARAVEGACAVARAWAVARACAHCRGRRGCRRSRSGRRGCPTACSPRRARARCPRSASRAARCGRRGSRTKKRLGRNKMPQRAKTVLDGGAGWRRRWDGGGAPPRKAGLARDCRPPCASPTGRAHGAIQLHVHVVLGDRRLWADRDGRLLEAALVGNRLDERNGKVQSRRRRPAVAAKALDHPLLSLWHRQNHRVPVALVAPDDDAAVQRGKMPRVREQLLRRGKRRAAE